MAPNGRPAEVLREAAGDDPCAVPDERVDRVDDPLVEELHLVDADRVVAGREPAHLVARLRRDGAHLRAGVRDDVADVVAVVDQRLDDQGALAGDLGAAQAANQLLALAAEHRPADDLEPAAGMWLCPDHGGRLTRAPDVPPVLGAPAASMLARWPRRVPGTAG